LVENKKIPGVRDSVHISIQKIFMPNNFTHEEKQQVQRLCSYGILAAIVSFQQATTKVVSQTLLQ